MKLDLTILPVLSFFCDAIQNNGWSALTLQFLATDVMREGFMVMNGTFNKAYLILSSHDLEAI